MVRTAHLGPLRVLFRHFSKLVEAPEPLGRKHTAIRAVVFFLKLRLFPATQQDEHKNPSMPSDFSLLDRGAGCRLRRMSINNQTNGSGGLVPMKSTMIVASLALMLMPRPASAAQDGIPALDHAFVIVLENHAFTQIVGSGNAPFITALAAKYNTATNYGPVSNPSLPNYLALVAGDYFGVNTDAPSTISKPKGPWSFNAPTIGTQLEGIGKEWRSYQEDIPAPGSLLADWPGSQEFGSLYSVRHNPFMYFQAHQTPAEVSKSVPLMQLFSDLVTKHAPAFSLIVPNMCNDMHNNEEHPRSPCGGYSDAAVIARGDYETSLLVNAIIGSDVWEKGKNALFLIFDGDSDHRVGIPVPAIVVTNYGVRGIKDPTSYSHYSLLKTLEAGFALPYLGHAADATTMTMAPVLQDK